MGLDKAYKMVISSASPNILKNQQRNDVKMIFKFYPNQKQIKYANYILYGINISDKFNGIPVFIADGLTIRKGKDDVIPIFFTREDLEEAWLKMSLKNPDIQYKPTIIIGNLLDIVKKMEIGKNEYAKFGFYPPKGSVEFVKKENKQNPSAKIHNWFFNKY